MMQPARRTSPKSTPSGTSSSGRLNKPASALAKIPPRLSSCGLKTVIYHILLSCWGTLGDCAGRGAVPQWSSPGGTMITPWLRDGAASRSRSVTMRSSVRARAAGRRWARRNSTGPGQTNETEYRWKWHNWQSAFLLVSGLVLGAIRDASCATSSEEWRTSGNRSGSGFLLVCGRVCQLCQLCHSRRGLIFR